MELIRNIIVSIAISTLLFISCSSCDGLCLDGGNETTIQIEVPFEVSPQKEVYQIGDTITLSLFMDEYYSLSTNESLPIKENLIENFLFHFYDSAGYKHPPKLYFGIDSFEYILDSNAQRFYYSSGRSSILFRGHFDELEQTVSFYSKFIPKSKGFYILAASWTNPIRNPNLLDITDDCGKEYYTLESLLNNGENSARNTQLVENDTSLLRKTLDGTFSGLTTDSILGIPNLYYFYVE